MYESTSSGNRDMPGEHMKNKILIVDDDKELLFELEALFDQNGYEVTSFPDGRSAMKMLPEIQPDIILLDLKMDGISGFQVADLLYCSPDTEHIPILGMTGYYTEEEHELIRRLSGVKNCIMKPFAPQAILSEVNRILSVDGRAYAADHPGNTGLGKS